MDIQQLIQLMDNKLIQLKNQLGIAISEGNIESISNIEIDIAKQEETLYKLKTLI